MDAKKLKSDLDKMSEGLGGLMKTIEQVSKTLKPEDIDPEQLKEIKEEAEKMADKLKKQHERYGSFFREH